MKTAPFVREATGLVRELSWFEGMLLGVAFYQFAQSINWVFSYGALWFPGANIAVTLGIVGLLINVPLVIVYSMFAASMPRSGGEYIYVSRAMAPGLGFAVSLAFLVFLIGGTLGPSSGWYTTGLIISNYLAAIGSTSGMPGLVDLSKTIVQPMPAIGIGLVFLLVTFVLVNLPTGTLQKVIRYLGVFSFLGWPIGYIVVLAISSNAQFISAFNSHVQYLGINTSYDGIISAANQAGATIIAPPSFGFGFASLAASPLMMLTYCLPNPAVYVAGETKHAARQVPLALISGIFVIAIFTLIMGYLTYNVFGYNFIAATAYLGLSGVSGYQLPAMPYPNYFMTILYPNPAFALFMMITGVTWTIIILIQAALCATRIFFGWSFDRLAPSLLADVNERTHSPLKATIVAIIVGVIYLVLSTYSFFGAVLPSAMGWTLAYMITMIAGITYPFHNKAMFDASPTLVRKKIAGVPLISLLGTIGGLACLLIMYFFISQPSISGITNTGALITIGFYVVAVMIYYGIRTVRKRQGIDLNLVFRQIPPE